MDFYYLEMPVIALYWKNTHHIPTMLSRDLEQEFPLITFSYISLTAGAFVLNYPPIQPLPFADFYIKCNTYKCFNFIFYYSVKPSSWPDSSCANILTLLFIGYISMCKAMANEISIISVWQGMLWKALYF